MVAKLSPITSFVRRSLVLSGTSGLVCLFAGIITVLIGVIEVAQQQGSGVLGLHLGLMSRLPVIGSLDELLSRDSWMHVGILITWTIVLVLTFGVIEFLLGGYADLSEAGKKARHHTEFKSERQWLFVRSYQRLVIGLIAIVCAMFFVQLAHSVSAIEKMAVSDISLTRNAWRMALAALSWALIYYAVIVFVRLYRLPKKSSR